VKGCIIRSNDLYILLDLDDANSILCSKIKLDFSEDVLKLSKTGQANIQSCQLHDGPLVPFISSSTL